jgi:hypothetical protein
MVHFERRTTEQRRRQGSNEVGSHRCHGKPTKRTFAANSISKNNVRPGPKKNHVLIRGGMQIRTYLDLTGTIYNAVAKDGP